MRELQQVKWYKYLIGTARATTFEGEPWVDAIFEAETLNEVVAIIEKRFNNRIQFKKNCGYFIEEQEPLSWEERFGLLYIFDCVFTPIYRLFITEEILKPAGITNPIQEPFDTLWSFCARLTKQGNMLLYTSFPPAHPDSDSETAGVIIDCKSHRQSEFFDCSGQSFFNILRNN